MRDWRGRREIIVIWTAQRGAVSLEAVYNLVEELADTSRIHRAGCSNRRGCCRVVDGRRALQLHPQARADLPEVSLS
jgi:hypothetical protein